MTDSSHADISDSICQWLTKELTGLARVSTNVALARQFDSVDLVQMTWQSVLRNHRSVLRSWKRDRIRAFLRGIMAINSGKFIAIIWMLRSGICGGNYDLSWISTQTTSPTNCYSSMILGSVALKAISSLYRRCSLS